MGQAWTKGKALMENPCVGDLAKADGLEGPSRLEQREDRDEELRCSAVGHMGNEGTI